MPLHALKLTAIAALFLFSSRAVFAEIGVGATPIDGAEILLDGSREMLDEKWTYWEGPRFASSLPIKWKVVPDPVDGGTAIMTDDPAAAGGKFGAADIVTKQKFRDFRLHVEFLITKPGGNSGVYLQNRHEIQILDGDDTAHGMAAVINEKAAPYEVYNGLGKWNAYDVTFRAARLRMTNAPNKRWSRSTLTVSRSTKTCRSCESGVVPTQASTVTTMTKDWELQTLQEGSSCKPKATTSAIGMFGFKKSTLSNPTPILRSSRAAM